MGNTKGLLCRLCGQVLEPGQGDFYVVRIEAVADPTPPSFTEEDLLRDPREEIERLLEAMRGLSAEEALAQVYRNVTAYLCGPCYRRWIDQIA
ncbi:MAG TPA: hypothetical protein EYP56_19140 [Planctomycetaceae bacterium]|nr:hypothetical protein [Planctomycetaceae bacterium]